MEGETTMFDPEQSDSNPQLERLIHRLSEFVALYETAEQKLEYREQQLQQQLQMHEGYVSGCLENIKTVLGELERVMTETGVARWRLAAEEALREGEAHVQQLQDINEEFRTLSNQTCDRLEQASSYAVKSVGEAVGTFRQADFKQIADKCCERIENMTSSAVNKINIVTKWFYWKKIILVFAVSTIVAVITGLYINDEWPWEDHHTVMHEREIGQAAMHAWQQLSPQDKARIMAQVKQK